MGLEKNIIEFIHSSLNASHEDVIDAYENGNIRVFNNISEALNWYYSNDLALKDLLELLKKIEIKDLDRDKNMLENILDSIGNFFYNDDTSIIVYLFEDFYN